MQATSTAGSIIQLFESDRRRIHESGKSAGSALRVHELFKQRPIQTVSLLVDALGISKPTAAAAIAKLESLGIVREESGRRRGRYFAYHQYIEVLNEGTQ